MCVCVYVCINVCIIKINVSRAHEVKNQRVIAKGSCPYYLAPSRGGVEARAGPHDADTENPIMSTPHPYLVTGGCCV